KSAQIREILISESAWEEMTCLFAPSLVFGRFTHSASEPLLHDVLALGEKVNREAWAHYFYTGNADAKCSLALEAIGYL
ncbi:hypothetical protein ACH676_24795, partial [Klebsiella pneumoniae]